MVLFDKFILANDTITKDNLRKFKEILDWNFSYCKELEKLYCAKKRKPWKNPDTNERIIPDLKKSVKTAEYHMKKYCKLVSDLAAILGYDQKLVDPFCDSSAREEIEKIAKTSNKSAPTPKPPPKDTPPDDDPGKYSFFKGIFFYTKIFSFFFTPKFCLFFTQKFLLFLCKILYQKVCFFYTNFFLYQQFCFFTPIFFIPKILFFFTKKWCKKKAVFQIPVSNLISKFRIFRRFVWPEQSARNTSTKINTNSTAEIIRARNAYTKNCRCRIIVWNYPTTSISPTASPKTSV